MSPRDRLAAVLSPDVLDALRRLSPSALPPSLRARPDPSAARWLTLDQAAERLGCSRNAVRMRCRRGRLETRRQGRRLYISAAAVAELA